MLALVLSISLVLAYVPRRPWCYPKADPGGLCLFITDILVLHLSWVWITVGRREVREPRQGCVVCASAFLCLQQDAMPRVITRFLLVDAPVKQPTELWDSGSGQGVVRSPGHGSAVAWPALGSSAASRERVWLGTERLRDRPATSSADLIHRLHSVPASATSSSRDQ